MGRHAVVIRRGQVTRPVTALSSLGATGPEAVFEAGGHGKAIARAMYHPELIRHPDSCPALVLNADYTPLSYYPLSLWPWQTAVKAMFLERSTWCTLEREVPTHRALKLSASPPASSAQPVPASRVQTVPARRFRCVYAVRRASYFAMSSRAQGGRTTWENVATACAPCNLRKGGRTPHQAKMHFAREPIRPTSWQLQDHGKSFPPNYLHQSWRDYLYWDVELEP